MSYVSPDKAHWMALESLEPDPSKDEMLPTLRLSLQSRWRKGPLVLAGVETLCATEVRWTGEREVLLRLPVDRSKHLHLKDGDSWDGVTLRIQTHEDGIKLDRWSPDRQRRLLVIAACESEAWNLYLRRPGEPAYNAAMESGWDDPALFGGFESTQPPLSLEWTGPRSAEIKVAGKAYGVTLKDKAGDVRVKWSFVKGHKMPEGNARNLEPLQR